MGLKSQAQVKEMTEITLVIFFFIWNIFDRCDSVVKMFQCVVCSRDCVYFWDSVWFLRTCSGNLRGMLWMAQKECCKGREKRGMRCGEGEKEMAGRPGGFPAVCFFYFFRKDSCRVCLSSPWQLIAGGQQQYQVAGCENPIEKCFHEPTECDVNDSGGNTPICRMCSVFDGECLGVLMKLIPDVVFISFPWAVSDRFSTNHKQINTWKCTWKYAKMWDTGKLFHS